MGLFFVIVGVVGTFIGGIINALDSDKGTKTHWKDVGPGFFERWKK